jgi:hypothetical protein
VRWTCRNGHRFDARGRCTRLGCGAVAEAVATRDDGAGGRLMGNPGSGEAEARAALAQALGSGVGVTFVVGRGEASGELRDRLEVAFPSGTFVVYGPRLYHAWRPRAR